MPLGHLGLNVASLARAKAFYDTIMPMVEFEPFFSNDTEFSYRPAGGKIGAYLFFYTALESGDYSRHQPGLQHLAFIVRTRAAVQETYSTALDWARSRSMSHGSFPSTTLATTRVSWRTRTGSWSSLSATVSERHSSLIVHKG
jgi:catechol-2,3-dioxygenase